jgi:hypothetical protein
MEDYVLRASLDERTTLYVCTLDPSTFDEHVDVDNLGGGEGYFVIRTVRSSKGFEQLDILAKAPSFDAAGELFDLVVARSVRQRPIA